MLEKLEQNIANLGEGRFALLSQNRYKLYELKKESWVKLASSPKETVAAFVDGGQCELVKAPSAELHRIRTAVVIVNGKKMAAARQKEGYALATATVSKDNINSLKYAAELFESSLDVKEKLEFVKGELASENEATALGKAAATARRLCELAAARWAVKELGKDKRQKMVVLDGTLETFTEKERKEMESLQAEAKENDVVVAAVAKTCTLMTDTGESLIAAAERISDGEGYVVAASGGKEKHLAVIAIAKLNNSASHLFRVEAGSESSLKEALQVLKAQANDVAFPGYPYGLVMADRFARISNSDTELTKARLMATAGSKLKALIEQSKALDAHSILDRM